ncbi:MAG: M15 family metallopeptidase [Spirochaetota bacterium]
MLFKINTILLATILLVSCKRLNSKATPTAKPASKPKSVVPKNIYGNVEKTKYLVGNYSSNKHLKYYKDKVNGRSFHMRHDVYRQFLKMQAAYARDASSDRQKVRKIFLRSAFRSFWSQKYIWESKYTGKRKMGKSIVGKSPAQKVNLILEYSSAPGTSRHHWGTDLDLNALSNAYFKKGGQGEYLYQWLLKNAYKYGFCQTYNSHAKRNFQGYFEERWHWSYAPIANRLQADWNEAYKKGKLDFKKHLGDAYLSEKRPIYVNAINSSCAKITSASL